MRLYLFLATAFRLVAVLLCDYVNLTAITMNETKAAALGQKILKGLVNLPQGKIAKTIWVGCEKEKCDDIEAGILNSKAAHKTFYTGMEGSKHVKGTGWWIFGRDYITLQYAMVVYPQGPIMEKAVFLDKKQICYLPTADKPKNQCFHLPLNPPHDMRKRVVRLRNYLALGPDQFVSISTPGKHVVKSWSQISDEFGSFPVNEYINGCFTGNIVCVEDYDNPGRLIALGGGRTYPIYHRKNITVWAMCCMKENKGEHECKNFGPKSRCVYFLYSHVKHTDIMVQDRLPLTNDGYSPARDDVVLPLLEEGGPFWDWHRELPAQSDEGWKLIQDAAYAGTPLPEEPSPPPVDLKEYGEADLVGDDYMDPDMSSSQMSYRIASFALVLISLVIPIQI